MSIIQQLKQLPADKIDLALAELTEQEAISILYSWEEWARENQKEPPGLWTIWLILAGRGWGKTRTGAEWIRQQVKTGKANKIALVAPTAADARDVMVEGPSGILSVFEPSKRPHYEPSKRKITFHNGAIAHTYSADEPERLRGPEHDAAWLDELCAWRYEAAIDNLRFGLRAGENPRAIITTTPKPVKMLKEIMAEETTIITRGSTFENKANLAKSFLNKIVSKYQGTRLGRQELMAEILDDNPGALWTRNLLEENRVQKAPELTRLIVSIDPATTSNKKSDETGIIIGGLGTNKEGYVLEDLSGKYKPNEWAKRAVEAFYRYKADMIIAESNQGGEMVEHTIKTIDKKVPVKLIHSSRGKQTRAEPISSLYEQHKIHHIGFLPDLEEQMTSWIPGEGKSPDRIDATVHLFAYLMLLSKDPIRAKPLAGNRTKSTWGI